MRLAKILLTYSLCCAMLSAAEAEAKSLKIQNDFVVLDTTLQMDYCFSRDSDVLAVAGNGEWAALKSAVLQERSPGDRLWLRLKIENHRNTAQRLVLASGEARTDSIRFFAIRKGGISITASGGDLLKRVDRPHYLAAYFPFEIEAGESAQIFMWIENPIDLAADFTLVSSEAFAEFGGFNYLLQGFFFGALLVLMLYYGAIYLSRRSLIVGSYFLYLLAAAVFFAARTGLLYQACGFYFAQFMNVVATPLPALIYATGIRFARAFLELRQTSWPDRILRTAQYVAFIPVPVAFYSRILSRELCDWLTLILGPGLLVFVWGIRSQIPKASLFLLGWCWPIVASLLQYTGGDSSYMMRNVLLQTSMLIEFIFFAIFVGRDISRHERERNKQRVNLLMLQEDLEQARQMHETLLPAGPPAMPGLDVHRVYRPMSELGGDYYDWFKLGDHKIVLFVADVTGHGLPAALDAAVVHIAFQSAVVEAAGCAEILSAMNQKLIAQGVDRCVSAVCAIYDGIEMSVEVALAGHPQAIVVTDAKAVCLGEHAALLGFSAQSRYTSAFMAMKEGDRLFLCTDGVYENPESELVDDHAEFADLLATKAEYSLEVVLADTIAHFDRLRQYRNIDDITLLGAQVLRSAG